MRRGDSRYRVKKSFFLKTFGCQMNEHDSLKMAGLLSSIGYQETTDETGADLILFNTCTIRQKAHDKAFSEVGKVLKKKESLPLAQRPMVGLCGCVAQEEGSKLLSRFPGIDLIFGPDQIHKLPILIDAVEKTSKPALACDLVNVAEDYHFLDGLEATRLKGPSAFVTIMKGCNSHCSYCIVPAVRGTEVYRPAREIVREIDYLAQQGCKEVTLLGQNVNSYGTNAGDGITFAKLIRLISENTDVARIRFTSPHPKDVRDDLIEEYATNPKLCSHIHLPLQSGSDEVLKRMRRAYNTKTYLEKVRKLRQARPDIAVTTDLIVGFPGETEEDFQKTLAIVEEVGFDQIFTFKYSSRPGTEAAVMPDDVEPSVKEERLARLLKLERELARRKNEADVGKIFDCLVEGEDRWQSGSFSGRNSQNKIINFTGQAPEVGDILRIKVTKARGHSLTGEAGHAI